LDTITISTEPKKAKPVAVIGAGKFGMAVANLLAKNSKVLLYTRSPEICDEINTKNHCRGIDLDKNIQGSTDLEIIASRCTIIFPIIPSNQFIELMKNIGPLLKPSHIVIHGIKGLLLNPKPIDQTESPFKLRQVHTISDVIKKYSLVERVGCLSGPNLASEILEGQPTATVLASEFDEVIKAGVQLLSCNTFYVFGSNDLIGAELAGALKNIVAMASGVLQGLGLGKNIQGVMITRGLREMILIGRLMGSKMEAFIGTAGIGDLIATATSEKSRNFRFGVQIAKGKNKDQILKELNATVEGLNTLEVVKKIVDAHKLHAPISKALFSVVYEGLHPLRALDNIMKYPHGNDVDYMD